MWDNGKILKLIELYHRNEILWKTKHSNYKADRYLKLDIFKQIADELQVDRNAVEQKIHTLRTQFTREYKRVLTDKRNGQVLTPTWFAYKPLTFLIDYMLVREKATRPKNELKTVSDTNEEATAQVSHEETKEEQFCEDSRDSSENRKKISNYESSYNPTPNKKQKTHTDEQNTYAMTSQEYSRSTITDDCSIFAEYIAREMRKIKDDTILAMTKHQITNVLFETQMKYYESTKNKRVSKNSPGIASNYNSEKNIRTSIEVVPIKLEVD